MSDNLYPTVGYGIAVALDEGTGSYNYAVLKESGDGLPVKVVAEGENDDISIRLEPKGDGTVEIDDVTAEVIRLTQQASTPDDPPAGTAVLYSINSGGSTTPAYRTPSQVVVLPGLHLGDSASAWWNQPIGFGRSTSTTGDRAPIRMRNNRTHNNPSEALNFGAWFETITAVGSNIGEYWGVLNDFDHFGGGLSGRVSSYTKMTRNSTAGTGPVWSEVFELIDDTGKTSGSAGSSVVIEANHSASGADDGTLADGHNINSAADVPGANRRAVDVKLGNADGTGVTDYTYGVLVAKNGGIALTSVKNAYGVNMTVTFAGLNMRQVDFGANANGVLMQVGDNSTIAWTADALSVVPSNYSTIKGTGTAGNLGVKVTTIGTGTFEVAGDFVATTKTPASAAATGTAGTIAWDASYIYVCVASNTWKRVAIATW